MSKSSNRKSFFIGTNPDALKLCTLASLSEEAARVCLTQLGLDLSEGQWQYNTSNQCIEQASPPVFTFGRKQIKVAVMDNPPGAPVLVLKEYQKPINAQEIREKNKVETFWEQDMFFVFENEQSLYVLLEALLEIKKHFQKKAN